MALIRLLLKVLVVNDCSHSSKIFEIPGIINLLARGRNRDGLFQDGTEGGIARSDGIWRLLTMRRLAVRKASRTDSTAVCFLTFCSKARSWELASF